MTTTRLLSLVFLPLILTSFIRPESGDTKQKEDLIVLFFSMMHKKKRVQRADDFENKATFCLLLTDVKAQLSLFRNSNFH